MAKRAFSGSLSEIPEKGLTVLRTPETEASVDIVFVHGFTGHPYKTWLKEGVSVEDAGQRPSKSLKIHAFQRIVSEGRESRSIYWPTDLLPESLPDARILTYGYDTHITHPLTGRLPSQNTVYDIAWNLLVELEPERRLARDRPLLFVAHSLGGIVVKEMLRRSQGCDSRDHLRQISSSTIGIVFFGTPHSGADPQSLLRRIAEPAARLLGFAIPQAIVDSLLPSAERLRQLREEFPVLAKRKGWLVHSFQEQLGVGYLGGKKVVEDPSSCLDDASIEVTQHIANNHMDMCRFMGALDVEYRKVVAALERLIHFGRDEMKQPHVVPDPAPKANARQCQEWLESLSFAQMGDRQTNIKRAHRRTCKWFLKQLEYIDWQDEAKMAEHNGVLWVKGNPGTGKSTLMKYLLDCAKKGLRSNKVVSFFFHARGDELEKSTTGMYRHLLHQILQKVADDEVAAIWDRLIEDSGLEHLDGPPRWTVDLLKDLFRAAVLVPRHRLTCFVDALDECDEDEIRDMLAFFAELGEASLARDTPFQVCFSSRHYPHITVDNCLDLKLEDQAGHERDIVSYLETELRIGKTTTAQQVRAEMLAKASGIFMWVVLVTQIMNREFDRGHLHSLRNKLRDIPKDLHTLFESILTRDGESKDQLLLCIQWTLLARRPLSPEELYFAMLSGAGPEEFPMCHQPWNPDEATREDMKRFIVGSSKGLTEVTSGKKATVQFIHESVRDYLRGGGLGKLWPEMGENFTPISHEVLKTGCLNYIQRGAFGGWSEMPSPEIPSPDDQDAPSPTPETLTEADAPVEEPENTSTRRARLSSTFPFLTYALQNVIYHADCAQQGGMSQIQFLRGFPREKWINLDNAMSQFKSRQHTTEAGLLYLLAEQNAANLIKAYPEPVNCFPWKQRITERYGVPLVAAIAHGAHEAIWQLLVSDTLLSGLIDDTSAVGNTAVQINKNRQNLQLRWNPKRSMAWYLCEYGHPPFINLLASAASKEMRSRATPDLVPASVRAMVCADALKRVGNAEHQGMLEALFSSGGCCAGPYAGWFRHLLNRAFFEGDSRELERLLGYGTDAKILTGCMLGWGHPNKKLPQDEALILMIEMLVNAGYDADAKSNNGFRLLDEAVWHGRDAAAATLIKLGAKTRLHAAAGLGQMYVVTELLDGGADVDQPDRLAKPALWYAARNSRQDMLQLLLERGANPSLTTSDGRTVLHGLATVEKPVPRAIIDLLVRHGARVDAKITFLGYTPLMEAIRGERASATLIDGLLHNGASVNATDNDGKTPLHHLTRNPICRTELGLLLLERGADPNARDRRLCTPLHHAAQSPHWKTELVLLLLAKGADPNAQDDYLCSPLHLLVDNPTYKKEHVLLLLQHGADPNAQNRSGCSPLHTARTMEVAEALCDHHANLELQSANGDTPILCRPPQD